MTQKPNDCICPFPVQTRTNHSHWCPSHARIIKKRDAREKDRDYWDGIAAKDAYGRDYVKGEK